MFGNNFLLFTCLLFFLFLFQLRPVEAQAKKIADNKKAIKKQQDLLEVTILKDLEKIKEKFNKTVDNINEAIGALKNFTDISIEELKNHTRKNMNESDAILDKNLRVLENYTHDRFDNFNKTMLENLDRLSNHTAKRERLS